MSQAFLKFRVLLIRLTGILLIYSILRLLFTTTYYCHLKGSSLPEVLMLFVYGLRYDLAVICILNSAFIVFSLLPLNISTNKYYQRILMLLFVIVNAIAIAFATADIGYFRYSNRRMTGAILNFLSRKDDSWGMFYSFFKDFWYLFLLFFLMVFCLYLLFKRTRTSGIRGLKGSGYFYATCMLLIAAGLSVIAIRGGLQSKPLKMIMAGYYCKSPAIPFVLNTPYTLIETISESPLQEFNYFPAGTAVREYNPQKDPVRTNAPVNFSKKNVVIIILESFSKEYTSLGGNKSYTPFLDSLMTHSLVMTNAYSNGKQSIEGIPAILASLPSWFNEDYLTSSYGTNKVNSIGSVLKQQGYATSFYHGGKNGTMNFIDFVKLSDGGSYYGLNEYPDKADFDGKWGIWDEPYLQYFAKEAGKMRQPFFTGIFTLSSHNPFKVPGKCEKKFTDPGLPILKCVRYTDHALKLFFDAIKTQPWFNNTLFVFTADHTGLPNCAFNEISVGNYQIPIFFYRSDNSLQGTNSSLFQQVDIMPTIMDMLHNKLPYFSFGNSLYDTLTKKFALYNIEKTYHFINQDTLIQFDGQLITGVYDLKTDSLLRKNLLPYIPEGASLLMKSVIQTYNNTLINNKTVSCGKIKIRKHA